MSKKNRVKIKSAGSANTTLLERLDRVERLLGTVVGEDQLNLRFCVESWRLTSEHALRQNAQLKRQQQELTLMGGFCAKNMELYQTYLAEVKAKMIEQQKAAQEPLPPAPPTPASAAVPPQTASSAPAPHTHPGMEAKLGVPPGHVIVDKPVPLPKDFPGPLTPENFEEKGDKLIDAAIALGFDEEKDLKGKTAGEILEMVRLREKEMTEQKET